MKEQITDNDRASKRIGGLYLPADIFFSPDLTLTEKHIYCYILAFHTKGITCFQTTETIANRLGLNHSMVRRCISRLDKIGYIERRRIKGRVHILCYKLTDAGLETNVTESNSDCYELKQELLQNETHSIISNNTSNNNYKSESKTAEEKDPTPHSEKNTPEANTAPSKPKKIRETSPKVPAKGVPCPDHEDDELRVRMPIERWEKLTEQLGLECCIYQCSRIEKYLTENPKKKYSDFAAVIRDFHNRATKDGHVFGWSKDGGYSYKKPWAPGFKIGGRDEK